MKHHQIKAASSGAWQTLDASYPRCKTSRPSRWLTVMKKTSTAHSTSLRHRSRSLISWTVKTLMILRIRMEKRQVRMSARCITVKVWTTWKGYRILNWMKLIGYTATRSRSLSRLLSVKRACGSPWSRNKRLSLSRRKPNRLSRQRRSWTWFLHRKKRKVFQRSTWHTTRKKCRLIFRAPRRSWPLIRISINRLELKQNAIWTYRDNEAASYSARTLKRQWNR
jgi:hypothetical protein